MVLSARGSWTATKCWYDRERTDLRQVGIKNFTSLHKETEQSETTLAPPPPTTTATVASSMQKKRLLYYSRQIEERNRFGSNSQQENCTMVVVTYKRTGILSKFLNHYCKIAVLQKILVIWNDNNASIPGTLLMWTKRCKKELKFIRADSNELTNRYIPRKEIETDCKFFFCSKVSI